MIDDTMKVLSGNCSWQTTGHRTLLEGSNVRTEHKSYIRENCCHKVTLIGVHREPESKKCAEPQCRFGVVQGVGTLVVLSNIICKNNYLFTNQFVSIMQYIFIPIVNLGTVGTRVDQVLFTSTLVNSCCPFIIMYS